MFGTIRSPASRVVRSRGPVPGEEPGLSSPATQVHRRGARRAGTPVHLHRQRPGRRGHRLGLSGDLRYAITQADQTTGDNTINFSVTGTIWLNSVLPDLNNKTGKMDIEGPGADQPDRGPQP